MRIEERSSESQSAPLKYFHQLDVPTREFTKEFKVSLMHSLQGSSSTPSPRRAALRPCLMLPRYKMTDCGIQVVQQTRHFWYALREGSYEHPGLSRTHGFVR